MAVIRVEKNGNYTTMCNLPLRDPNLSLKAKGLLAMCLSLPDDWVYNISGLTLMCKEGRDSVMTVLKELEANGYLTRHRIRLPSGRLSSMEYVIYEQPQSNNPTLVNPTLKKSTVEDSTQEESTLEDTTLLSTNIQNKEYTNKRITKDVRHKYGQYRNVLFTDEEFGKLQSEFPNDYEERIERLSEYMESTGKSYKNHLATIRNWARRDKPQKQIYSSSMYEFKEGESL